MEVSRLKRRYGRLGIKLATNGEDSRGVPCANVNLEASLFCQLDMTFLTFFSLLHSIFELSCFWNFYFFRMHVANLPIMHFGMGSELYLLQGESHPISGHVCWHGVGSQTLRHWNFTESSWCCRSSALPRAWRAGRLGTAMRKKNSTDQMDRITGDSTNTDVSRRTKLHNCVCWMSTRTPRGLTSASM